MTTAYDDDSFDIDSSEQVTEAPCSFLTGSAGCGKTYEINRRISENPNYALLCATTGIAAVNMGENVTTINAALKYFDTDSLMDSFINGRLASRLNKIAKLGYENLVIDEVSMMAAEQLDIIVKALDDLSCYAGLSKPMGLILTGDFCQLPVIKAKWAFEAECWPRFEFNTLRLTKCWRQSNETFQAALSAMRSGNGQYAVELLDACGVRYADNNDLEFSGTSIMSKNDEVDRFNWLCHSKVKGAITRVPSTRWGKLKGEWKLIPENLQLRIGAYVMVLANSKPNFMTEAFDFVNGDCGTVVDHDSTTGAYTVKLKRNDKLVTVTYLTRRNEQKERPSEEIAAAALNPDDKQPYYDSDKHRWVIGEVRYIPLRLAYATTCHKAQGLTLDAVQINLSNAFFGAPAMAYTALSRCREANGLRIVGTKELLSRRVCVEPKVRRFL